MRARRRIALAAATAVLVCGCGRQRALTSAGSTQLRSEVSAVQDAVARQDPTGATVALDQLRTTVALLEQRGELTAARGQQILLAASAVERDLPTTTTTTTALESDPAGHGHGKGDNSDGG